MPHISAEQLALEFESNPKLKIKVFNLGENAGMDLAYFCHYHVLKELFPEIVIDLCRSNVDETNCIGQETYRGKVKLPVDNFNMAIVKQRYPDGSDWIQKLNKKDFQLFQKILKVQKGTMLFGVSELGLPNYGKINLKTRKLSAAI